MTTQQLIAHYADRLKERTGVPLPSKVASNLAAQILQLQKDKVPSGAIVQGLDLLLDKSLPPSALASAVVEAATRNPNRGTHLCPICDLAFRTQERLEEHMDNVHHVIAPTAATESPKLF